jgi:glyoxalase superfamily protein
MSSIEQLKSLEAKARAQGHAMKHCDALEQVARSHGYDSWRACRAILADPVSAISTALPEKPSINNIEMNSHNSREWNFALDIAARWNAFPAVPTNSPNEVIRFASHESGVHLSIIFRNPYDPKQAKRRSSIKYNRFWLRVASETSPRLKLASDHLWCRHSTLTSLTTKAAPGVFAITSCFMARSCTW